MTTTFCPLCQQSTEDPYNDHQWCPENVDANSVPFRDGSGEPVWFVSVFGLTRSYGGPEEGGWWFDEGPRVALFVAATLGEAEDIAGGLDPSGYVDEENDRTFYRITRGIPEGPWWSDYRPYE